MKWEIKRIISNCYKIISKNKKSQLILIKIKLIKNKNKMKLLDHKNQKKTAIEIAINKTLKIK